MSDGEAITLEIVGEVLGHDGDEAIWSYFKRHWAAWLPGVRGSEHLRAASGQSLTDQAGIPWAIGGGLGGTHRRWPHHRRVPCRPCEVARAVCGQVLKAEADCGYCATRREHCYGLKAHLLIDWRGVAVGVTVTATNVDERDAAHDVLSAIEGPVLGDKGYIRPQFRADCGAPGIDLQTPVRRNMQEPRPRWWLKLLRSGRGRIETVIGQREQRFNLAKTRARDIWRLTHQATRKLLAHTVGVWRNLRQGREPLDLDGLLAA